MFWVIRWTDLQTNEDHAIVVEAPTEVQAETIAHKRGIPLVHLGPADDADIQAAREAKLLWAYSPKPRYTCFGQPVRPRELACLMLCGVWVIGVLLKVSNVLPTV